MDFLEPISNLSFVWQNHYYHVLTLQSLGCGRAGQCHWMWYWARAAGSQTPRPEHPALLRHLSPNSLQCSVQRGRSCCLLQSAKLEPLMPAQSPSVFSSLSPVLWGEALGSVCTSLVALWICNAGLASHTGVTGALCQLCLGTVTSVRHLSLQAEE